MTSVGERLQRRVQNIYHLCVSTTVADDSGAAMTLQMTPDNIRTFDAVPMVQQFGLSSSPPVGSQILRFNLNGDCTSGIAVSTMHQASRPRNLKPGQTNLYDQSGSSILLSNDKVITFRPGTGASGNTVMIMSEAAIDITAPSSVSMTTPMLRVSGSINADNLWTGSVMLPGGKTMDVAGGAIVNVAGGS